MPTIDAHSHLGPCRVFDLNTEEQELLTQMNNNGIDTNLVQPYPGADPTSKVHDMISAMAKRNPGRFYGIASINPHQDKAAYFSELSRCVKQLGFVGVKMHTIGHAVNPGGVDGTTIFESASHLDIPVMIHTGPGIPFAAPSAVSGQLKKFPKVRVVLAHAGYAIFTGEAIAVADRFPQVTLEFSGCGFPQVNGMIKTLGANRVMFGSDLPPNVPVAKALVKTLGLKKEDEAMVMGGTALEVFRIKG
ncbi:MAG: amidohydrolase [SAR202 cluster bacterium]|nr:amidohydrolase [SAR202 cluster bacterium]